jgi:hypothetical protein
VKTPGIIRGISLAIVLTSTLTAQYAELQPVPPVSFPAQTDSNSPAFWNDGELVLFNSTGDGPIRSSGSDQFNLGNSQPVVLGSSIHRPYWIESTSTDEDGTILAWYHHEPPGVCHAAGLTAPEIGALMSKDGGKSFIDLGIVLESGYPADCSSQNGYFAGGHGDFSVVLNQSRSYFYFLFSNYGGPPEEQGVAVARLPFYRRYTPIGAVEKFYDGRWQELGIGGRVTPIFRATVDWQRPDTDSFWGPSVHWNPYLGKYVMMINRSCCSPGWPQEGIYISYNSSLSNPAGWSVPEKILDGGWWYPQVLGRGAFETDSVSRRIARLYVNGISSWRIVFHK